MQALDAAPGFGLAAADWAARVTEATGGTGPFVVILLSLLAAALAYGVEWGIALLFQPRRSGDGLDTYGERLGAAALYALRQAARLCIFWALATAFASVLTPDAEPARELHRLVLSKLILARMIFMAARVLFRPDAPALRPANLTDAEARKVMRAMMIVVVASAPAPFVTDLVSQLMGAGPAGIVPATLGAAVTAVMLIWFFLHIRREIGGLIVKALTREGDEPSATALWLSRRWHWFYIAFVGVNALFALRMMLLGSKEEDITSMPMVVLALTPFLVAGLEGWRREEQERDAGAFLVAVLALAQGVVAVGAAAVLLTAWDLPLSRQEGATGLALIVPSLVRAAAVIALGFAVWIAVEVALGRAIGKQDEAEEGEIPDEGAMQGGSRFETIAPILRGFALAAIVVITGMTALSTLGMDIGPLLAGAGVLGLAIGFGAQKLVADIISGIFYLYEDSFRLGEYIVTEEGKGVVERISLRSARLRHHRGPVYTIPFSSMGTIQNHSRDWVKVKFQFQVPSDTDLEMVRKLVKKVGAELEQDAELQGMFLEPLKSQGAVDIQGHSYVIGCKYTTRPGMQFTIRRRAFAALQKALTEKGVKLYAPRIMVDAAEDPDAFAQALATGQVGAAT